MKRILLILILFSFATSSFNSAKAASNIQTNSITGKSVLAGALSLIIWPGIGQAVNSSQGDKVLTHALVGLIPPFRFWSGYDALVRRKGGYWNGKV